MRVIDADRIKQHARERFRSEYHYAVFEYYRSAKVLAFLEQHGVTVRGRILDAGCGGGGMPVSLAEEGADVTAIDLKDRFVQAGERLRDELGIKGLRFAQADGLSLPFASGAFAGVLSHAVIEHVADADRYLGECARVLEPGGWMYLSTSPYLSFAGAHLPRLVVPVPLHLLLGRRASFALYVWLARHASWTLREKADENTFVKDALHGRRKHDDLLELVRVRRLRGQIAQAGFRVQHEELTLTTTFQRLPRPLPEWIRESAWTQDIAISVMQYVLFRDGTAVPGPPAT